LGRALPPGRGERALGIELLAYEVGKRNGPPEGGPFPNDVPAATYSPTQLPRQYHRRWRA
jgi:hypothetical protein